MGARAIHERDPRLAGLAQGRAKFGDQFETGRAAARDHNVMQAFDPCSHVYGPVRLNTNRRVRFALSKHCVVAHQTRLDRPPLGRAT